MGETKDYLVSFIFSSKNLKPEEDGRSLARKTA